MSSTSPLQSAPITATDKPKPRHSVVCRSALKHTLKQDYLIISHRWEEAGQPDSAGQQLNAICKFLNDDEGKSFKWVWLGEFYCRTRTAHPCIVNAVQLTPLMSVVLNCAADYWCMPQRGRDGEPKSPIEAKEFKMMLKNVNLLYLGGTVLVLLDNSYLSRFWTQYEVNSSSPSLMSA